MAYHDFGEFGSPPHAWGKFLVSVSTILHTRFTPTRVGKINKGKNRPKTISVHPHTRGENHIDIGIGVNQLGSPPHAWGK